MLAWKEIERDLEEAKQQQQTKKRNGAAIATGGGGEEHAWWQGRLRALRERDWTMYSELERLRGEWARLDGKGRVGKGRVGKVSGGRTTL